MTDWLLLALFISAYLINKNTLPSLVAYFLCVMYQVSLFDYHDAVTNHLIYSVIFIPAAFFATIVKSFKQAYSICAYSLFHALYATDWVLSGGYETIFSLCYYYSQVGLALCLIYFSFEKGENGNHNARLFNSNSNMVNLWYFQTHSKKSKRA